MKLSEHFTLKEFTQSYLAQRLKIDNTAPEKVVVKLKDLCENVLEIIRSEYNRPITINSGYRCSPLNKAVKGVRTSQHLKGEAADIEMKGVSNREIFDWIKNNVPEFDQLILECHNPEIPDSGWVHVSFKKGANRKQALELK